MFWTFALLLMLAPLPFGMVHGLFQAAFACAIWALVLGYCMQRLLRGQGPAVSLRAVFPETVGFLAMLLWAAVQTLPATPEAWGHPLWSEAGATLENTLAGSISLARGAGLESLLRLATYGAVFWLALQWGRDRKQAARLVAAVAVAGTAYALYGLITHFRGHEYVLWVEKTAYIGMVTGTFINRNSFATYAGLCLLCAGGTYLAGILGALQSGRRGRDRTLHVLQQAFIQGAPLLAACLVLLTALFLTSSRAGVTASVTALLVMLFFMGPLNRLIRPGAKALAVSLLAALLVVFLVSGGGWLDRLTSTDLERDYRAVLYAQTWAALAHSPLTGFGLGAYQQAFLLFADERTSNSYMAHNDWLEMIFELGWPAAGVWFLVLAGLAVRCLIGFFRRKRDNVYPLIGLCACILAGLHCLADFSLQIPAVAVTLAALLGVGAAQGRSSRQEEQKRGM